MTRCFHRHGGRHFDKLSESHEVSRLQQDGRRRSKGAAILSMGAAILLETRDIARPTVDQWPLWSTRLFGLVYMLRELCVERSYTCGVENHVKCVLLA